MTKIPLDDTISRPLPKITDLIDAALNDHEPPPVSTSSPAVKNEGEVPKNNVIAALPLPQVYYDEHAQKPYLIPKTSGGWVAVTESRAAKYLIEQGFDSAKEDDELVSELNRVLTDIVQRHCLDYAGSLAGYPTGPYTINNNTVLVTKSADFINPNPGSWELIKHVAENLFGPVQLPYVYAWLKLSLLMYQTRCWQAGPALVMCGPKGAGKNLFTQIIKALFGGRIANPYQYMTDRTTFNYDLFASELLAVEDKGQTTKYAARKAMAEHIREITATKDQRCHRKHGDGVMLTPLWRIVFSLNDDPERIMVLPPMTDDIDDKIMLLKVEWHPMPMFTNTGQEQQVFENAWKAEIPAFAHFLTQWAIPQEIQAPRYGFKAYHHPEILRNLASNDPEKLLWPLIEEVLFGPMYSQSFWRGTASELHRKLLDPASPTALEARELVSYPSVCGNYLGRLQRQMPDRIDRDGMEDHSVIWVIRADKKDTAAFEKISARLKQMSKDQVAPGSF